MFLEILWTCSPPAHPWILCWVFHGHGGSSSCWVTAQLHSQSFETTQNRDEFQMMLKILCYCYKSWGFFPFALFWVDSEQVWQEHGIFSIYGIRSGTSETPHRSLFLEREKIRLNRTGNAVMKEWKYFHYTSICMSTADREWCETFPEGLPKIFFLV